MDVIFVVKKLFNSRGMLATRIFETFQGVRTSCLLLSHTLCSAFDFTTFIF